MFDTRNLSPEELLMQASQIVEDAAFDMASDTPVNVVARLIVISAELQELASHDGACPCAGTGGAPMRLDS